MRCEYYFTCRKANNWHSLLTKIVTVPTTANCFKMTGQILAKSKQNTQSYLKFKCKQN